MITLSFKLSYIEASVYLLITSCIGNKAQECPVEITTLLYFMHSELSTAGYRFLLGATTFS